MCVSVSVCVCACACGALGGHPTSRLSFFRAKVSGSFLGSNGLNTRRRAVFTPRQGWGGMQAELVAEAEATTAAATAAAAEAVKAKQTLFRLAHLHMFTKLRPHVHQFLSSMQVSRLIVVPHPAASARAIRESSGFASASVCQRVGTPPRRRGRFAFDALGPSSARLRATRQ